MESFGKKKYTNKDWFEEKINLLKILIKIKRQTHVDYQHDSSSTSLNRQSETKKLFERPHGNALTSFG